MATDALPTPTQAHLPLAWNRLVALGRAALYSGAYVALGDAVAVVAVAALLGVGVGWDFVAIVALGLFATYGFNRFVEARADAASNPDRASWIGPRRRRHAVLVGLAVVGAYAVPVTTGRVRSLGWVSALLGLGLAYSVGGKALTRRIPAFKTLFVTSMFAALVPFLAAHEGARGGAAVVVVAVLYGTYVAINTVCCDLKDLETDRAAGLRTLPIVWGPAGALRRLHALNVVWGAVVVAAVVTGTLQPAALALLPLVAYRAAYLRAGRAEDPARRRFLADVVADAESLLWPLLLAGGVILVRRAAPEAPAFFPWPRVPALVRWSPGSRTPLVADETEGALACGGMALVLGAALRWLLQADRPDVERQGAKHALFLAAGIVVVALAGLNVCFATIALSLVAGAALVGSLRSRAHLAGAAVVVVPCVALQATRIEGMSLLVLTCAAAADEGLARLATRASSGIVASIGLHRPVWKATLVGLTVVAGWPVRYVLAVLAFDAGYALVDRALRRPPAREAVP